MIYMLIPEQMNIDIRPLLFIIILPALVISSGSPFCLHSQWRTLNWVLIRIFDTTGSRQNECNNLWLTITLYLYWPPLRRYMINKPDILIWFDWSISYGLHKWFDLPIPLAHIYLLLLREKINNGRGNTMKSECTHTTLLFLEIFIT